MYVKLIWKKDKPRYSVLSRWQTFLAAPHRRIYWEQNPLQGKNQQEILRASWSPSEKEVERGSERESEREGERVAVRERERVSESWREREWGSERKSHSDGCHQTDTRRDSVIHMEFSLPEYSLNFQNLSNEGRHRQLVWKKVKEKSRKKVKKAIKKMQHPIWEILVHNCWSNLFMLGTVRSQVMLILFRHSHMH